MTGSEILSKEIDSLVVELVARHDELKMRASGRWADSVEGITTGTKGVILANSYTEQLVNGREPGRFPPVKDIERWIYEKGIKPFEASMKISTLAFLIARKIAKDGTKYFQQGGTDLVSAVITPERIQDIIDKVSDFHVSSFTSDVTNAFKKLAA